jgi:hypothetical protein
MPLLTFFNGAFNSNFIESETQKVTLTCSIESFELAIQWMYTGDAVLPPTVVSDNDKVSRFLDFLKLADFLHLTGPFTSIDEAIHEMVKNRSNLQSKHKGSYEAASWHTGETHHSPGLCGTIFGKSGMVVCQQCVRKYFGFQIQGRVG